MRKPVKFKRYSKGGGVDSSSDFEDTPDSPDSPEGGYVRDSEGKRVRSTYGYVTYGEGPKKAQKPENAERKPPALSGSSGSSSSSPSSPSSSGPSSSSSSPALSSGPPKPNRTGKSPDSNKPQGPQANVSDEEPFSISPPADKAKTEEDDGKSEDLFRTRPSAASQRATPPRTSPSRAVTTSNKPLTPITPVENKPKMEFKAPKSLPSAEPKSLTSSGSKSLPAPTAAEKAAEIARLQKIDRPLQPVETLPGPGKLARLALSAGKEFKDKLLGGERTPQRPPEAKLELPAPAKAPALPAPPKPPTTVKSDVTGKARPPRPLPDTPDTKDKDEQREALKRKARMAKKAAANREKAKTFSKGGSVSSRADGCVQRGKTRGKVC